MTRSVNFHKTNKAIGCSNSSSSIYALYGLVDLFSKLLPLYRDALLNCVFLGMLSVYPLRPIFPPKQNRDTVLFDGSCQVLKHLIFHYFCHLINCKHNQCLNYLKCSHQPTHIIELLPLFVDRLSSLAVHKIHCVAMR